MNNYLGYAAAATVGYFVYDLTDEVRLGITAALGASLFVLLLSQQIENLIKKMENIGI